MAYGQDLRKSAIRHLKSADTLYENAAAGSQPGSRAVAGYLYGLSGELALKNIMSKSGMKPTGERNNDPFYAHFPNLKSMLMEQLSGRMPSNLRKFVEDKHLFQFWGTKMRYSPTGEIDLRQIDKWKKNAKDLIEEMDL